MAIDQALASAVRDGAPPTLRLYRWSPPCLSLGRNQPARGRYRLETLRSRGIDVVRRPTGGRAVLHDRELTYSVAVREGMLGSPRESYAVVNRALVAGIRRLGVDAALQPAASGRAPAPSLAPCFADPAAGEVVVGGRKLVGSAQRRERGVLLQHGSLLLEGDQSELQELLREPIEQGGDGFAVSLSAVLGEMPAWERLVEAFAAGWKTVLGTRPVAGALTRDEEGAVAEFVSHFADPDWTWHR